MTEKFLIEQQLNTKKSSLFMQRPSESSMKSTEKSRIFKMKGNEFYSKKTIDVKTFDLIIRLYNKSICLAPLNSECLSEAYGNRSALYFRLKRYPECILDISRALACSNLTLARRAKLLIRKAESHIVLQDKANAQIALHDIKELIPQISKEMEKKNSESVFASIKEIEKALSILTDKKVIPYDICSDLHEDHLKMLSKKEKESPNSSVIVKTNENEQSYLVTRNDVMAGDIIYVDKPFCGFLNIYDSNIYCGHCFKEAYNSIPCDFCSWCSFCSEKCKTVAWTNYHDLECRIISHSTEDNTLSQTDYLALRSLILGIKKSGSINNFKNDLMHADESTEQVENGGFNPNGKSKFPKWKNQTFKSVYTLPLTRKITNSELQEIAIPTTVMLMSLCKYTDLFGNSIKSTNDIKNNEEIMLIGTILFKLRRRLISNSHFLTFELKTCRNELAVGTCKLKNCCFKLEFISSLSALLPHSCYPNAKICAVDNERFILYALRPIPKENQIYVSKGQLFYEMQKAFRVPALRQTLRYKCKCQACNENWPNLTELYKMPMENPIGYMKNYSQKESSLFDEFKSLLDPILKCQIVGGCEEKILKKLSYAMKKATDNLTPPSVVLCELMMSIAIYYETAFRYSTGYIYRKPPSKKPTIAVSKSDLQ
ncbi:SET and MYND domain-containing protein 4-like [Trichogramma pretiosum]|uniref:SET and MYND domain-containing protein 4-like n=1 Tax=Trichogramma pretiosum TaxID=7493 RepID=UPI0006C9CB6F|nr:SET and MYND domain-containing protein 4-like [Trichogramma pretiosum]